MTTPRVHRDALDDAARAAWERTYDDHAAARYPYHAADGTLRYTVIRRAPKFFTIEAPDSTPLPDPLPPHLAVLYRLPEVLAAPPGATIHVTEGEKDADTLAGLGLTATTMPCGTRLGWQDTYTPHLARRHVVIWPDADGPGRRHADLVLDAVTGTAASAVTCDLHEGKRGPMDVTDWLARPGRGLAELLAAAERARLAAAGYEHARRDGTPLPRDRHAIIWDSALDSTGKLVLAALHDMAGDAMPPASRAAAWCSLHRVTAQNTISRLRQLGVLGPGPGVAIGWGVLATATW